MPFSNDHAGLPFVQARGFTAGRPDGPPIWIVVHDMEASETLTRAEDTAAYFANPSDGRRVSSHYCVDADSVVQCVDLDDSAWTVGNREGNNLGINWEFSGFARQTRSEWLDPFSRSMFAAMAPYARADARRFHIPLQRRTVAELRAKLPGVTSHNDLRLAFGGTTHTDPGPSFPWDVFMQVLAGKGRDADMFLIQAEGVEGVWKSDGFKRELQPPGYRFYRPFEGAGFSIVRLTAADAQAVGLTPEQYLTKMAGEVVVAPGPGVAPGPLGAGLSADDVRAIVRAELDGTRLHRPPEPSE